jgi:hypothetical protein
VRNQETPHNTEGLPLFTFFFVFCSAYFLTRAPQLTRSAAWHCPKEGSSLPRPAAGRTSENPRKPRSLRLIQVADEKAHK